jgi:hypothetical protein
MLHGMEIPTVNGELVRTTKKATLSYASVYLRKQRILWNITLANGQIDAQIFNTFITILYMYEYSVSDRPVYRTVTYWEWRYQMLY